MEKEKRIVYRKGDYVQLIAEDGLTVSSPNDYQSGVRIPEGTFGVVLGHYDRGAVLHVEFNVEVARNSVPLQVSVLVLRQQVAHA